MRHCGDMNQCVCLREDEAAFVRYRQLESSVAVAPYTMSASVRPAS